MTMYYTMLAANQQHYFPKVSFLRMLVYLLSMTFLLPIIGLQGAIFAALLMYIIIFGTYYAIQETRPYVVDWLKALITPSLAGLLSLSILSTMTLTFFGIWVTGLILYTGFLMIFAYGQRSIQQFLGFPPSGANPFFLLEVIKPKNKFSSSLIQTLVRSKE